MRLLLLPGLLLLPVPSLAFAPAPLPKPDIKVMQGQWAAVTHRTLYSNGFQNVSSVTPGVTLVVAGDVMQFSHHGRPIERYAFRLHGGAIDFREAGGRARSGIYKLERDTLTICDSEGAARPAVFSGDKLGQRLIVLKRVKR
jgi:uncharacterized protein (TIGR03067 family)